ncbi:hypothetical protein A2803_01360 [Candidatus Woesebacteria bacterium RIFCSPHIGHO2_01_FULL_44_21]|uniref:GrpB family protein n=1 Tax=Candidatus Woesebacteria bacterium RIFCSPHIGHO2_01_FULL_44_21 TaxID=1802503 RepID=A0A1F7Z158_9BACT|nr:MAG: hypothetical protein A2803_01360 [Candidatus Woesebacteria bacterium RIFCSPHIGHO2_01_FULL_44_21]OGM70838.1 MAG: hypothetical protein A2897_05350 [Candidatus Woesebacteria bacterium RIFCSPLOWO2_01_FULL_44_24b]
MQNISFKPVSKFENIADKAFSEQEQRILKIIPSAEVHHIGSTAIPNSITKGDLDINVRVNKSGFAFAVEQLKDLYEINQPENWTDTFASFKDDKHLGIDFGVQLTVIGSPVDDFVKLRDILISNPSLVKKYNQMKLKYADKNMDDYRKAKADFFQQLREGKLKW